MKVLVKNTVLKRASKSILTCSFLPSSQQFGAHFSDNFVSIFDSISGRLCCERKFDFQTGAVCFGATNVIAVIDTDRGHLKLYDVRCFNGNNCALDINLSEIHETALLKCMAISHDESLLVVGTEADEKKSKKKGDEEAESLIIFTDLREGVVLGSYKESHSNDITCLKFHPESRRFLVSGGLDGLVNVFDLEQRNEDDALQQTFNLEGSGVGVVGWAESCVFAISDHSQFQLWDSISGDDLCSFFDPDSSDVLVDCFYSNSTIHPFLSDLKGRLWAAEWRPEFKKMRLNRSDFHPLEKAPKHGDLIRSLAWEPKMQLLVTGDDDGQLVLSSLSLD